MPDLVLPLWTATLLAAAVTFWIWRHSPPPKPSFMQSRAQQMANDTEIYGDLAEIFHDVFMRDDIKLSPGLTAKGVQGWDSFKQIEIIMACEEKWGIKFNTRELDALRSVGDLATMVGKKVG